MGTMEIKFASTFLCAAIGTISLLPSACTNANTPSSPVSERNGGQTHLSRVSIGGHEVVFKVDREDLTVGSAIFSMMCFQRTANSEQEAKQDCDIFTVDGVDQPGWYHTMEPTGLNTFKAAIPGRFV